MEEKINELTILLLYLTSFEERGNFSDDKFKRSWKGYSFDALNSLTEKGLLYSSKNRTKSVTLTKEGEQLARELFEKYFGEKL